MTLSAQPELVYPERDGQPMSDNTLQFRWIVLFKENLECLFANDPQVFIAGDLLWYPVDGHPEIRVAPDAMVVFGRPKGDRGSYRQWQEDQIPPQVVFEVLSPGNRLTEMARKLQFYDRYGVEEYYIYDPDLNELSGFLRQAGQLVVIEPMDGWVSPRLGIRFVLTPTILEVYTPTGQRFLTTLERAEQLEQVQQQAEQAQSRAERLAARLRAMGVDPDAD
jgi:Uma2 family endonuclease